MNYDTWKATSPDEDALTTPEGEERCPDCGCGCDEPCLGTCGCVACRARDAREQDRPKDAA